LAPFHSYYGDDFKIELSGQVGQAGASSAKWPTIFPAACPDLSADETGRRPVLGSSRIEQEDIHFPR